MALTLATGRGSPSMDPAGGWTVHLNVDAAQIASSATVAAPMLDAQRDYINKLARRAVGLLPVPRTNKRKGKSRADGLPGRKWNLALKT